MTWRIVTDSSCDLPFSTLEGVATLSKVPFYINIEDQEYIDNDEMNLTEMLDAMESSKEISRTSCPSPGTWYKEFEQADCVLAITISKELSGSYNSAIAAQKMLEGEHPDKKVFVLNSRSAGSALSMLVQKTNALINEGASFEKLVQEIQAYSYSLNTIFGLLSFNNLIKNGRMSKLTGFIATKLNFTGIGVASPEGEIVVKGKARGTKKLVDAFLKDMEENSFHQGMVTISHCQNEKLAHSLAGAIMAKWPQADVQLMETRGLCSFYAERGGLIMAY